VEAEVGEVIAAARGLVDGGLVDDVWVALAAGRVAEVGVGVPPGDPAWRLREGVLAPGLVDAQVNGAFGVDLVDADEAGWARVAAGLPAFGVTAVVATFITAPMERLVDAVRVARARVGTPDAATPGGGARLLGFHVEGPFLSEMYRGAHAAEWLCDPSVAAVDRLVAAGGDALVYVTLAPERAGALEAIGRLRAAGVRVAVGHSDASDGQVFAAVDAGASLVTHLFNAQRPFRHRDPGVVGAALADARVTVGLIADLVHVAPTAIRVAFAAAAGRVMLVSDAVAALGMPEGRYVLGGEPTIVAEGRPPVRADGALAGSALRLDAAVANVIGCGVDPVVALEAASRVPADALGRSELGRIAPGLAADLVWLGPDWRTRATWIGGELVYGAPDGSGRQRG
jgi:N-acetylglucosamine-6-phosphate deacetylase